MKRFSFFILIYIFSFSALSGDFGVTKKQFIQKYNSQINKMGKDFKPFNSIKIKKAEGNEKSVQYVISNDVSGVGMFNSSGLMDYVIWFMAAAEKDDIDTIVKVSSGAVMMDVLDDSIDLSKASEMLVSAIAELADSEKNEFEFFSSDLKYKISKSDVLPFSIEVSKK